MSDKAKELPPPSLGRTIFNLLPLIILTWYLCQNRPDKDPNYQLDLCGQSLHTIGVDLEKNRLLSEDKLYIQDIESIYTGDKVMPACPIAGKESYVSGYQPSSDRTGYLLVCKGNHHSQAGVPSDFPRIAFSVQEASTDGNSDSPEENKEPKESPTPEQIEESPGPQESPEPGESPIVEESPLVQESPSPAATPDS